MTTADLLYSEDEGELRTAVRALLTHRAPAAATIARGEAGEPYDPALWRALAREVGCAGLAVPADRGGAGASWREAAVVAEEIGRAAAPTPFLGSSVVVTAALLALAGSSAEAEAGADDGTGGDSGPGSGAGAGDLLDRLAKGEATAALAVPFSRGPGDRAGDRAAESVRADAAGGLRGTITSVADSFLADWLLVPAAGPEGVALYRVAADAPGLHTTPVTSLDLTRPLVDLRFEAAPGTLVASGPAARQAVERALGVGAALLASEQLGIAQACLDLTVGHLKTRYQFARLIGSYQALKHRAADLWMSVAQARAVARYAAWCVATDDPDTPVAVALAQAFCSGVAVKAAEECVQLHGGIGFTWEHPAHLSLKRAKADAIAFGTPARHRAALAQLAELPGPLTAL